MNAEILTFLEKRVHWDRARGKILIPLGRATLGSLTAPGTFFVFFFFFEKLSMMASETQKPKQGILILRKCLSGGVV